MAARREREPPSLLARAIRLLARRDHSRAELARKLKRGSVDVDPTEIEQVLDQLERDKLLSDERYAASRARARSARFGDVMIRHDLKSSGVAAGTIERAVAGLKGTEFERAQAVWSRRYNVLPSSPAERARQARFLAARGFSGDVIRRVLRGLPADD